MTQASTGLPNYDLACEQHQVYVSALKACGLQTTQLSPLEEYPDSCFVEDVALLTRNCAILTLPGPSSRSREVAHIADAIFQITQCYSAFRL